VFSVAEGIFTGFDVTAAGGLGPREPARWAVDIAGGLSSWAGLVVPIGAFAAATLVEINFGF